VTLKKTICIVFILVDPFTTNDVATRGRSISVLVLFLTSASYSSCIVVNQSFSAKASFNEFGSEDSKVITVSILGLNILAFDRVTV